MRHQTRAFRAAVLFILLLIPPAAEAAAPDNNVEWNGISHVWWQDRRPLCPRANESFAVRIQAYRDDLTGARVHLDDGGSNSWITAAVAGQRGAYDIWQATIPATSADTISYWIELTDGTDTDYLSVSGVLDSSPADGGWTVDFVTLEHAPVGATLCTGGAVFRVWAPGATQCYVRGDFNGWDLSTPMTRVGEHFIAFASGASAGDEYKYYFNPGAIWKADARSRAFNAADNGNSIIEDPFGYTWTVDDFETPPKDQMIVYQLHVGEFAGRNDPFGSAPHPSRYIDVAARVSHLVELGVNAVMLNPVTEFPGDLSAGYNPVTAWAPEWAYGTPDELKYMVDVLHQNGIAVILDIVWNHFSFNDNYLWYYDGTQIYFDDPAVDTPWGSQADFDREPVREYYLDSALGWLEEYHIDGFRMDATGYMTLQTGGWSLMQQMNDEIDRRFAGAVVIAEQLPDDSWVTRPTSLGGAGFDVQYFDWFTDTIRAAIFDAATGDPSMGSIRDIIYGAGTYLSGASVLNYFELHDEAWPSSGGQRAVKTIDTTYPHDDVYARGRTTLAEGLVALAPGVPAVLMGTEWLEDADFGTDLENRIDWAKKTNYDEIFAYYVDLFALRTDAAFRAGASCDVRHVNEGGNVIAFRRWSAESDFVVIANFSNTDYSGYRIGLPEDVNWREVLNSRSPIYGGSGPVNSGTLVPEQFAYDGYAVSLVMGLPAMGLVVLQAGTSQTGDEPPLPRADALEPNYPNPFNPSTTIAFSVAAPGRVTLRVYDVSGRLVRTLLDGTMPAGRHEARWDGRTDRGAAAASGVYFCRLATPLSTKTQRIVLLR